MSEHEDHAARGRVAGGDQRLRRFHDCDQRTLVVERAAAPDRSLDNRTGKGRMSPALRLRHRHDILVCHQNHRRQRSVAPGPLVDQRAVADDCATRDGVKARVRCDEPRTKTLECRGVRSIVIADRLELQRRTQPRGAADDVECRNGILERRRGVRLARDDSARDDNKNHRCEQGCEQRESAKCERT